MDFANLCLLIGGLGIVCSVLAENVVFRRLKRAGFATGWMTMTMIYFPRHAREYLKIRDRFGWSALPVHLGWAMTVLGVGFVVLGLILTHRT